MSLTLEQALTRVPFFPNPLPTPPIPLTGGITNRNYRITLPGASFVLRLSGKNTTLLGIDRPTERAANTFAASLGIAPEVVYFIEPEGYLVTRFVEAQPLPVETIGQETWLARVATSLRRFHTQAPPLANPFDIFQVIATLTRIGQEHHGPFPDNFAWLIENVRMLESAFAREPYTPRPCHNDLLNGNFLNANDQLIILDWEYAGMGDVFFDLANFSHHHTLNDEQIRYFLTQYFGSITEKHFARLKLMEPLSDLREALWGTVQTAISTLDEDFAGYARQWYQSATQAFQDPRVPAWLNEI
ncbi:MAG: phosphotransferase family protein [Anaerolineales bacterium]